MKVRVLATSLLALLGTTAGLVYAQHASKTPTAEVDQEPRSADSLGWERPSGLQDSRLAGGSSGALPESRVPLPALCDVMPEHPSCEDESGGGGGGDGEIKTAHCGLTVSPEIGFSQMMTVTNNRGSLTCVQGGHYTSSPDGGGRWISVGGVMSVPIGPEDTITWSGDCAGQTGGTCRTTPVSVDFASPDNAAQWVAQATVTRRGKSSSVSFTVSLAACGSPELQCL